MEINESYWKIKAYQKNNMVYNEKKDETAEIQRFYRLYGDLFMKE